MKKVLLYRGGMKIVGKSGVGRALEHQARALENAGIPFTYDPKEDWDVVHLNTVFPDSLWMSLRARLKGRTVVYYGHSTMEDFRNSFPGSDLTAGAFRSWLRVCYGSADTVITPTLYSKRLLEGYGMSVRIRALSNGIDLQTFRREEEGGRQFREAFGFGPEKKVVLCVVHYIERKGILDFLRMAERFPEYEFVWFGHTPPALVTRQVKKAMARDLPNVRFPGFVASDELRKAYSGSDLFFFPTLEETEGIVMLEAMAMKIPVLVRDIPVYEGWLEHGKNVYKGKGTEEFERLLPGILEGDLPDLTGEAYRTVQENGIGKIGKALAEVYDGLERDQEALHRGRLIGG